MDTRTITRADLTEAVYEEVGLSRNETAELVEQVIDQVVTNLAAGNSVKISSFATFNVRQKGERIGRNPKTGVQVPIEPRKVITFKASQQLKEKVRKGQKSKA